MIPFRALFTDLRNLKAIGLMNSLRALSSSAPALDRHLSFDHHGLVRTVPV
jgi:hypothetical protein